MEINLVLKEYERDAIFSALSGLCHLYIAVRMSLYAQY